MIHFSDLTTYDIVVLGIIALLIARGLWLGMLKQVTGLLALYFAYFIASRYSTLLTPLLSDFSDNPKVVFITSCIISFVVTYVAIMLIGKGLSYVLKLTITSWFDRILGGLVGFAKAAILVVVIHMVIGAFLTPENQMLRDCVTCNALNQACDFTRSMISDEEARKAFVQQKPAIALDAVKGVLTPPTQGKKDTVEETSPRQGAQPVSE